MIRRLIPLTSLFCLSLFILSCSGTSQVEEPDPEPSPSVTTGSLTRCADCDQLLAQLQAAASEDMNAAMDYYYECPMYYADDDGDGVAAAADDSGGSEEASGDSLDYTDTNLQEAGVDEADIWKSDGEFLYVATDSFINAFQVSSKESFELLSSYELWGVQGMFLRGDELIALTEETDDTRGVTRVVVSALNVSDPSEITLSWERKIDGTSIDSRLVSGVLHLAVSTSFSPIDTVYPDVDWYTRESATCDGDEEALAELTAIVEAARAENQALIEAATLDEWIPHYDNGSTDEAIACTNFLYGESLESSYIGLLSLDLDDSDLADEMTLVSGSAWEVYASTGSFYVMRSDWDWESNSSDWVTYFHRFDLSVDGALHQYTGDGAVPGYVENSFSMSESNDTLRVATELDDETALYVLDATQSDMPIVGEVDGIAPGESLYAARFVGDKAYIVTYEQIDPLFVIDLSDPTAPEVLGELEVPGFSTYLHPLSDGSLLGFGSDTEEGGLLLSLFDVSEATVPSLVTQVTFGEWDSYSEATTDHHAFTLTSDGILVLPVSSWDTGGMVKLFQTSDDGITSLASVTLSEDEWSNPSRTLIVRSNEESLLYVLNQDGSGLETVSLIDMEAGYEVIEQLEAPGGAAEEEEEEVWDVPVGED